MEKPADRTKQAGPPGAACRFYPGVHRIYRRTWALGTHDGKHVVWWRWGCVYVLVCSWVCASVGHAQSRVCGRQRASANIHSARQAADRLESRATPSAGIACDNTPARNKIPQTQTQSMQHAFTSLPLSKPQLFPPAHPTTTTPPQFPSKPTFTIQAAVHPRKESILNLIGLILLIDFF